MLKVYTTIRYVNCCACYHYNTKTQLCNILSHCDDKKMFYTKFNNTIYLKLVLCTIVTWASFLLKANKITLKLLNKNYLS